MYQSMVFPMFKFWFVSSFSIAPITQKTQLTSIGSQNRAKVPISWLFFRIGFCSLVRPMTTETRCFHKKLEFQRYPPKYFCTARYERKSSEKKIKLFKNPEKNHSWADLGPRSAWEKLSQMFVRSGEIPSPGQTSIDKTNDCAMKSERGAPVRGSYPPFGHTVHKTTGDRRRAPARRLIQTHLVAAV